MPDVTILEARVIGDDVAIHGYVDGAGYRITVPKADIDKAKTKFQKQDVAARLLLAEWQRERPDELDLKGTVRL